MRSLICLTSLLLAHAASAGTIEQHFGAGILGVKWGTPLAEVQSKFPVGQTWETSKIFNTDYVHSVRVDTEMFGLESKDLLVHFAFDEAETFIGASIYFPYDRKEDVLYRIAETLGQNYHASSTRVSSRLTWPSESNVQVVLSIGDREPHKWVALYVYKEESRKW